MDINTLVVKRPSMLGDLRVPRGNKFTQEQYMRFMFEQAEAEAKKSNDPDRKVGCVITIAYDEAQTFFTSPFGVPIMGSGCNVVPEGTAPEEKLKYVKHAEVNAVAAYKDVSVVRKEHARPAVFVTRMPCFQCAQHFVGAEIGINASVIYVLAHVDERKSKWWQSFREAALYITAHDTKLVAVTLAGARTLTGVDDFDQLFREFY